MKRKALITIITVAAMTMGPAAFAETQSGQEHKMGSQGMQQSQGSTGKQMQLSSSTVREVEQALKEEGYNPGSVDGQLDQQAKNALKDFQKAEGIQSSGEINVQTARALGISGDSLSQIASSEQGGSVARGRMGSESGSAGGSQGTGSGSLGQQ